MAYKTHFFLCTNGGENPEKCAAKGAEGLRIQLKKRCQEAFGKGVRVNAAGCLGYCENGITAVLYPQNKWSTKITPLDEDHLFEIIKAAQETDK